MVKYIWDQNTVSQQLHPSENVILEKYIFCLSTGLPLKRIDIHCHSHHFRIQASNRYTFNFLFWVIMRWNKNNIIWISQGHKFHVGYEAEHLLENMLVLSVSTSLALVILLCSVHSVRCASHSSSRSDCRMDSSCCWSFLCTASLAFVHYWG